MKKWTFFLIVFILVVGLAGGAYWWHSHQAISEAVAAEKEGDEPAVKPVVTVQTEKIRSGTLTTKIISYGTVIPAPGAIQTVSVSFECKVLHVLVSEGQLVSPTDPLLEIAPSPETALEMEQARNSFTLSQQGLQQVQQQFALKFASNEQLLTAKQIFQDAKLKLESLQRRGIDGPRKLTADFSGLITKVNTQNGALVAAGTSLVELVAPDQVEVKLGFELEDISRLQVGQPILLHRVNAPEQETLTGKIRAISQGISPTTQLVDVFVSLPPKTRLFLEAAIQGTITTISAPGLIVPHAAVLPEEDQYVLYTVTNNHASKHIVEVNVENDQDALVTGKDLHADDAVVVMGNYELEDGMSVKEGTPR